MSLFIWSLYFHLNFINLSLRFFPNLIKSLFIIKIHRLYLWGTCGWSFLTSSREVVGFLYLEDARLILLEQALSLSFHPSMDLGPSSSRFQLPIVLWDNLMYPKLASKLHNRGWSCTSALPPQCWIRGWQVSATSPHLYVVPRLDLMALCMLVVTLSAELTPQLSIIFIG